MAKRLKTKWQTAIYKTLHVLPQLVVLFSISKYDFSNMTDCLMRTYTQNSGHQIGSKQSTNVLRTSNFSISFLLGFFMWYFFVFQIISYKCILCIHAKTFIFSVTVSDPCKTYNMSCKYGCTIENSKPTCYCSSGYRLNLDGQSCRGI